jgi:hypothetical protein
MLPPKGHGGGGRPKLPTKERQIERFGPTFQRLRNVMDGAADDDTYALTLRSDPSSLAPERMIVFEIAGSVDDFTKALSRVPGFEFIAESDTEGQPDDDFAERDTRKDRDGQVRADKPVAGRFYLAMPDITALRQLVRLWEHWTRGEKMEKGFAPFNHLFAQLRALRPWGVQDRIPEDTIEYWQDELQREPDRPVRTEIELWYRKTGERRDSASSAIRFTVAAVEGTILHEAIIEDIAYHGLLIEIPAQAVRTLTARGEVALALADDVMFLRPQSVLAVPLGPNDSEDLGDGAHALVPARGAPIAALLDSVPLQGHALLSGRLVLDDPDDLQARALVAHRVHGTAMASLILHGDLNAGEPAIDRPLYVRPLLVPSADGRERTDGNRLVVDTVYRAVLRIKGVPGQTPAAPSVFLINLSLADARRPFASLISPLARLLDFLSAKFNVLFLVSAGNVTTPLEITGFTTWTEFQSADPAARERAVLAALNATKHERTLLSPAESLNALTIGAHHSDKVPQRVEAPLTVDPYEDELLPNPSSALGLGYRRMLKPELYLPGGREHLRMRASGQGVTVSFGSPQRMYGLAAAAPDSQGQGRLNQRALSDGTSSATALATRAGHRIFSALMDAEGGSVFSEMPQEYYAVAVKALLLHRARWNGKAELLGEICGPVDRRRHLARSENVSRFMGFGVPNVDDVLECAVNRATLLGYGELTPEHAHAFRVPLPGILSGITDPRFLTITLAWFSPTRPGSQSYRCVKLEAAPLKPETTLGVKREREQPAQQCAMKGCAFHERFTGSRAVAFLDDGQLALSVWCREDAEGSTAPTRYAIAVTIETETAIAVYDEIRQRLRIAPRPLT